MLKLRARYGWMFVWGWELPVLPIAAGANAVFAVALTDPWVLAGTPLAGTVSAPVVAKALRAWVCAGIWVVRRVTFSAPPCWPRT
jgi:hypothetical protein